MDFSFELFKTCKMKNMTTDMSEKGPERMYKTGVKPGWLQSNRNTKNQTKWGKKKAPDGNLVKEKGYS